MPKAVHIQEPKEVRKDVGWEGKGTRGCMYLWVVEKLCCCTLTKCRLLRQNIFHFINADLSLFLEFPDC